MKKKEFFELYDKVFLPLGFTKDEEDPLFPYSINLASEESIEENELEPEDIPKLLYGNTESIVGIVSTQEVTLYG